MDSSQLICGVMLLAFALGTFLRPWPQLGPLAEKTLAPLLLFLLFLFGIEIGANPVLMNQLGSLGLESILLGFAGIVGSIAGVKLMERWFFRNV